MTAWTTPPFSAFDAVLTFRRSELMAGREQHDQQPTLSCKAKDALINPLPHRLLVDPRRPAKRGRSGPLTGVARLDHDFFRPDAKQVCETRLSAPFFPTRAFFFNAFGSRAAGPASGVASHKGSWLNHKSRPCPCQRVLHSCPENRLTLFIAPKPRISIDWRQKNTLCLPHSFREDPAGAIDRDHPIQRNERE